MITHKDNYEADISFIRNNTTERERLEMMAEESAEVIQQAIKVIRSSGVAAGIPTPVTYEMARANLAEEINDLILCAYVDGIKICPPAENQKAARWANRIKGIE